jgi:hypothetical protein
MFSEVLRSPETDSSLHKPKARWSAQEDNILQQTIDMHGPVNWNFIALSLVGRTGKQCRERWLTKLSPEVSSEAWTANEDATLIRLQSIHGNQWSKFRAELPHRSTTSIKNRWGSLKRQRPIERRTDEALPTSTNCKQIIIEESTYHVLTNDIQEETELTYDESISFDDFSWYL